MNQEDSTPNGTDNEARDPLLAALWQRVEGYGQAPPPGAWASIRQQLVPPAVLPQPAWWHRLLPNLWSKRFLFGSLTVVVVAVNLLVLRHRPQHAKHLPFGSHPHAHSGQSATGPGRSGSPRLSYSPAASGSRAVLPIENGVHQPDWNGSRYPRLLQPDAAPPPAVRPSVTVANPDGHEVGVVANPLFTPEAGVAVATATAKGKTGSGDEATEPGPQQVATRRARVPGTATTSRLAPALSALGDGGAARNQRAKNQRELLKRLVLPHGRKSQRQRTAVVHRQMRAHVATGTPVATGVLFSEERVFNGKPGLPEKGRRMTNALTNTGNRAVRLPVLAPAAAFVGTDALDGRQRSPNSFAIHRPDAAVNDEPLSKRTQTSDRSASELVAVLPMQVAAQIQSAVRPLTLPVPDSSQVVPARPGHSRWALLAVAGPTFSYRTLGSLAAGGARSIVAQSERPALGYGAQAQVQRALSGRWSVAAGLGYQEYATNLTLQIRTRTTRDTTTTYQTVSQRDTYRLLTLPVQLGYHLGQPHGRLTTAMLAGIEPAWYQGGRSTECACLQRTYSSASGSPYQSWTLGASIGFDLRYRVSRSPAGRLYWVVQPTSRYVLTPFMRPGVAEKPSRQPFSAGFLMGLVVELR